MMRNQKGSTIAIVLIVILIMGMILTTLMFTGGTHRKERSVLEKSMRLFYMAESGINHAFHMLLKGNYNNRFYQPASKGEIKRDYAGGKYEVTLSDTTFEGKPAIEIISKATLDGTDKVLKATAVFNHNRRIKMYCTYYCDEEITNLWELKYDVNAY